MDLTDLTIQPGKIHLVREILRDGVTGSVRVLGSLKSYDAAADVAVVDYKGDQLTIDACLLTDFQFRIDSLYEFIGEVQGAAGAARVSRRPGLPRWGGALCSIARGLTAGAATTTAAERLSIGIMDVSVPERGETSRIPPPATPEKVKVHFKPIANAPILRKSKFQVNSAWNCSELEASLRSMLQISDTTPLFLYCNSAFEPSPDQSLSDLYKCFNVNKELLMNYSITEAWV
ncbi:Autophagy-related protein 12 [Ectocarpus siliculosus]|uniref:Ubiquitin-like protein ATG12 n=1 Tax=Ectocarpus siliculosus TaxID=2880 RepID=D7G0N6_ECTSI|nr:Autophagy-related protein 12 [Ectocarpus siliculosus]|eukprot:CBJ33065.1 Autophagy-related protein 12 [Ectocarpus siliculosus]